MRRSILAATALAALVPGAFGQETPAPAEKQITGSVQSGDDAMTDVDPELLARCKADAARKRLAGAARTAFMNACVAPED